MGLGITEIEPKELPFYQSVNMHEYDKEKRKFLKKNGDGVTEVNYYSSIGKNKHIFLVTHSKLKYEVLYDESKIVKVQDLMGNERKNFSFLFTELIEDYIKKTEWLKGDDKDLGVVKMDNLYIKYGLPVEKYQPTYKINSRFYKIQNN